MVGGICWYNSLTADGRSSLNVTVAGFVSDQRSGNDTVGPGEVERDVPPLSISTNVMTSFEQGLLTVCV